jgi:hypothetical protein
MAEIVERSGDPFVAANLWFARHDPSRYVTWLDHERRVARPDTDVRTRRDTCGPAAGETGHDEVDRSEDLVGVAGLQQWPDRLAVMLEAICSGGPPRITPRTWSTDTGFHGNATRPQVAPAAA